MLRIASLVLVLLVLAIALLIANTGLGLSLVETLMAVFLIVGFAIMAAGWTIRRDV
jgi:hypothetical protein